MKQLNIKTFKVCFLLLSIIFISQQSTAHTIYLNGGWGKKHNFIDNIDKKTSLAAYGYKSKKAKRKFKRFGRKIFTKRHKANIFNVLLGYKWCEVKPKDLDLGNKDLPPAIDTSVTAPVPVPAAAWLFGTALLGVAVLRRKRA